MSELQNDYPEALFESPPSSFGTPAADTRVRREAEAFVGPAEPYEMARKKMDEIARDAISYARPDEWKALKDIGMVLGTFAVLAIVAFLVKAAVVALIQLF